MTSADLLRARAAVLARRADEPVSAAPTLDLIAFTAGGTPYAVESRYVVEVATMRQFTTIPCAPHHVLGVISLRGRLLAVVDLRRLYQLAPKALSSHDRALVLADGGMEFGVHADGILGHQAVPVAEIDPAGPPRPGPGARHLRGVAPGGLVVLDAPRLLHDPDLLVDHSAGDERTARE